MIGVPSPARDAVGQLLHADTRWDYDDRITVATLAGFPTIAPGPVQAIVFTLATTDGRACETVAATAMVPEASTTSRRRMPVGRAGLSPGRET